VESRRGIINLKTGEIISRGFAVCSNKEGKKKSFDEYAVLSMAQTRAIGKAYRNVIGWTMKLAGYETTPAEEMPAAPAAAPKPGPSAPAQPTDAQEVELVCHGLTKSGCGEELTKQEYDYSIKMYGKPLCRQHQKETTPITKWYVRLHRIHALQRSRQRKVLSSYPRLLRQRQTQNRRYHVHRNPRQKPPARNLGD
jgi:hypothetical protein